MGASIDLACAADAKYVPHSAVMIRSALDLHGERLRVHFLPGPDVGPKDRRLLSKMVEAGGGSIGFLEVDPARVNGLPTMGYISATMWNRIFLPELLPDLERILYLDADTIIMDSLEPLWKLDLDTRLVGAVTNVFQRLVPDRREQFEIERSDPPYFNSGVLLFNLELMRKAGATEALLDYARSHHDAKGWPDQDALNHVLGTRRHALHPRWNLMNSFEVYPWSEDVFGAEALAEARERPAIRHFEGPSINKPWHLLCERELRTAYRHHRRNTPWPYYLPDGLTPANILRRLGRRRVSTPMKATAIEDKHRFHQSRPNDLREARPWHRLAYIVRKLPEGLERLSRELSVGPGDRILDYGCADAPYRGFFPPDAEYLGADLPGNAVATVEIKPDGTVPVDDGSCDAVLSTQVLEHVQDPSVYLSECVRVLRPGGRLLLSTHGIMVYHPDPVDYWRWTGAGLQHAVERAGLEIERFEGIMGLGATGLQLVHDAAYWKLPRILRAPFSLVMQTLIRIADRLVSPESRRMNALVFALVAKKP